MASDTSKFPAWLASQLTRRGWSQRELADRLAFSEGHMSRMARAIQPPTRDTCVRLAQLFGVSEEEVWRVAGHAIPSDEPPPVTVADAVEADRRLTKEQKRLLIDLYHSWFPSENCN